MRALRSIVTGLFVMLIGSTAWAAACAGFTDVDSLNTTYCPAVTYLKARGITLGCSGTTYCPNDYVTRLQMALFLQRMGRGGSDNVLGDDSNVIGGGDTNTTASTNTTIGGGSDNEATMFGATVSGGLHNHATGLQSTVGGGSSNSAAYSGTTVSGGAQNVASGAFSTVPGGISNAASGRASFAAGNWANANLDGCFVWGDNSTNNVVSCGSVTPNQFVARSVGGVYFLTAGTDDSSYSGASLLPGATSWTTYSDRNGKDNIEVVDARAVLEHLLSIPVTTWNWKSQAPSIRHMGPMAQDFAAAFNLGETSRGINTVDADGVSLAAIQGLHQMLVARDAVIADQARELAALRARMDALEHAAAR